MNRVLAGRKIACLLFGQERTFGVRSAFQDEVGCIQLEVFDCETETMKVETVFPSARVSS